jgi:hypothetical protein
MSKGGRTLELLVAFIESALVPRGFSVTHGEKYTMKREASLPSLTSLFVDQSVVDQYLG